MKKYLEGEQGAELREVLAEIIRIGKEEDEFAFWDDHVPKGDPKRKVRAVIFVVDHIEREAWFCAQLNKDRGQCKNPLYMSDRGLATTVWSKGLNIEKDQQKTLTFRPNRFERGGFVHQSEWGLMQPLCETNWALTIKHIPLLEELLASVSG